MRRSAPLLLACLLALTTGVALLGASAMVPMPARETGSPALPPGDPEANAALVRRFYDAINTTVATGDSTPLVALIAADFADGAAQPGVAPTRAGLVQYVLALRESFPTLWLAVEELQAHGDWVLARVRAEGLGRGEYFGVPFAGEPAIWSGLDVFRIDGGMIAERWAAGDWPASPQLLVQAPLPEPPAGVFLRLARLTFAPGARQPNGGSLGPLLIAVETGVLTVRVDQPAVLTREAGAATGDPGSLAVSPGVEFALSPGDSLLLSPGVGAMFQNVGQAPVVVLALALLPWSAGAAEGTAFRWPVTGSPDITAQVLADGAVAEMPAARATIALVRITLAARSEITTDGTTWPRLAVVEAGALHLATTSSPVKALSAGEGTLIQPALVPTFRNAGEGPLVVLLVTITTAE